ncbi:MAG: hypothetical protein ACHQY2_07100 [Candidatus Eremiobacterales bacterium]|jgi:hypothetical protein
MFKQFTRVLVGISLAAGIAATVAACTSSGGGSSSSATEAPTTAAGGGSMAGGSMAGGSMAAPRDMGKDTVVGGKMMSRYGGPIYSGAPALTVTAALVAAGGGPEYYSTAKALTSMLGAATVGAEVKKLSGQYGAANVAQWLKTFDFAVGDALKIATAKGVKLPAADPKMTGKALATTLAKAGTAPDGTFQIEFLLDKAVSHAIHVQVMDDIDANAAYGKKADLQYHEISNQAFYDVAQALGATSIKLAPLH